MNHTLRLPAEVLCYIFYSARLGNGVPSAQDVTSAWQKGDARYHRLLTGLRRNEKHHNIMLAWISLTHVCSRWRALALNDTNLWTEVPSTLGAQWLREFLVRSGEQAVSVDWNFTPDNRRGALASEIMSDVVQTLYRRLRNFPTSLRPDDPLITSLSLPWPALEELDVILDKDSPIFMLLAGCAPRLRHLGYHSLSASNNCNTFPWQILDTLIVLDLCFSDGIHGASMVAFLDALSRMPRLRHLRLGNRALFDEVESIEYSRPLTQCACCTTGPARSQEVPLETLALKCDWSMTLHVMRHIFPPPTVRIMLVPLQDVSDNHENDYRTHEHLRSACVHIREWRHARGKSNRLESARNPIVHTKPYVALNVLDDWDDPGDVVRLLVSCSPAFPTHLRDEDWYKGVDEVHPDLAISHRMPTQSDRMQFVAAILNEVLQVLGADGLTMLKFSEFEEEAPNEFPTHFLGYLSDPVFQNIEILCLPWFSPFYLRSIINPGDGNSENGDSEDGSVSGGSLNALFPALKVLDFECCRLWFMRALGSMYALEKLLKTRRDVCVFIRAAKEVENRRSEGHYEGDNFMDIIDTLDTMLRARIIKSDANISYTDMLQWKREETSDATKVKSEEEEMEGDADSEAKDESGRN